MHLSDATRPASRPRAVSARGRAVLLAVAAVLALLLAAWPPTAHAASPTWTQQSAPGPAGSGFQGISCTGPSSCTAVGSVTAATSSSGPDLHAFVDTESNGTWRRVTVPLPANTSELMSVSCPSPTFCAAVGLHGGATPRAFTEIFRSGTWRIVTPAAIAGVSGAELFSVSCPSVASCVAVGWWMSSSGRTGMLAEAYGPHGWTLDKTPAVSGSATLSGISCVPATVPYLCTAVGNRTTTNTTVPLVAHLNGTTWTTVHVPTVASSSDVALSAVSCPQPTSCVAVGSALSGSKFRGISEVEDLLHWRVVSGATITTAGGSNSFDGVSCPLGIDSCRAVGYVGTAGTLTVAETWNGQRWRQQSSVTPAPDLAELLAVSCVTVQTDGVACTAGGEYQKAPMGGSHPLAERN